MIVLLNVDKKMIECYSEEGKIDVPFSEAMRLFSISQDSTIYYITNVTQTKAESIIQLIQSMGYSLNQVSSPTLNKGGNKYIHAIGGGTVMIGNDFKLEGKYDIRLFDKEMEEHVKDSEVFQSLIKNKKVEIIGEIKKESLLKELKEVMLKKDELQKKKDSKLDNMIIDKKVDEIDSTILNDESKDVEIIDMTSELNETRRIRGKGVPGEASQPSSMEELMQEINLIDQGEK